MAREVVEASVFWGGDLFAVKYFALGEPVAFDAVPTTDAVEVRTRVVEAAPKMPRNRWDLPLGALAITAACMNVMVVGSLAHDAPALVSHTDVVRSNHDVLVTTEPAPVADAAVGLGIVPVVLREEDERAGDEGGSPKIIDTFGDTGMIAMLGQYRGDDVVAPWAPSPHESGAIWADEGGVTRDGVFVPWGVGGLGLSGTGEGGGGGNALGNYVLDRVHTVGDVAIGSGHGHLAGHHVGPICHLPIVTAISCYRMPPELIQRIVRFSLPRFSACYADGLKTNPALTGRVVTKFVIGRDGSVVAVSDGGSDLPDDGVRACVQRAFMNLSFPETTDGGLATVTYPIVMSPE